mgnify:CR=1 FL=1
MGVWAGGMWAGWMRAGGGFFSAIACDRIYLVFSEKFYFTCLKSFMSFVQFGLRMTENTLINT